MQVQSITRGVNFAKFANPVATKNGGVLMETKEIVKCENNSKNGGIRLGLRNRKKTIVIGLLIAAILFSFLVAPVIVEKRQIVKCTQEILNSKKDTVATVTIFGSAASIAVGAVPGDSTTPLTNQIAEINAFFLRKLA